MRALGYGTDEQIIDLFGGDEMIVKTCEKDAQCKSEEQGKIDLFRRLRPGEVPTVEGANILIHNTFYDYKRYDLAKVGRYKYNKKLALATRIAGYKLAEDVVSNVTGEILAQKGEIVDETRVEKSKTTPSTWFGLPTPITTEKKRNSKSSATTP